VGSYFEIQPATVDQTAAQAGSISQRQIVSKGPLTAELLVSFKHSFEAENLRSLGLIDLLAIREGNYFPLFYLHQSINCRNGQSQPVIQIVL